MERRNHGAPSKGILVPVSESSGVFKNNILAPLKSAYLYDESKLCFRYKSPVWIKNPALEKKYNAFRTKRKEAGYSEEDLKESFGFLLFDDINKAHLLGETGVQIGNSTCTTLGDPSNGVYISMFSDCLDVNRWYHGKSGYIAILRLTKGRVKKVVENYTQNFTAPTGSFDCHVSEQLPSVSAQTSSFLAFERTQYYMYELLDDGSSKVVQSPSAVCPFAIVSFSYTDTKAVAPEEKSEVKKQVSHYCPWRGQLEIGTQLFHVELRSKAGALIPAELPPVVKVDRAISVLDLCLILPRGVFETCFSGEVFVESLYCSLWELVSSEAAENSLSILLSELKQKHIALTISLNDGGFLILMHSSNFLTYDASATEVLQGMFVFPESRVIQRGLKCGQKKPSVSSEILQVLPVLSYAESEVEKTPIDPSEELCEILARQMQSFATLINPGLASSPSRENSIFPDQYDVPDAHKHLYLSPEWTSRSWQGFKSYINRPGSYQLPVSKASEILVAGQEARMEDLDDDVYICLSSPEEAPANLFGMESDDELTGENVDTDVVHNGVAQVDSTDVPQDVAPDDLQVRDATKDTEKSDLSMLFRADDMGAKNLLSHSTSKDLPEELIFSFTSAKRTITDESSSGISTEALTKHNDFQISDFSMAKFTTGVTSLNDDTVETKKVLVCPEIPNLPKRKRKKPRAGHWRKVSKTSAKTRSLPTVEGDTLDSKKEDQPKKSSGHTHRISTSQFDWRKVRKRKCIFGKLSSRNRKRGSAPVPTIAKGTTSDHGQQGSISTTLIELEACHLRKKMERWDLKPVISECGRILVPHGTVDIADEIKSLKEKLQSTKVERCPEKTLVDASMNTHQTLEMKQESIPVSETAEDGTEATTTKEGANHLQNNLVSHFDTDQVILRQSVDGSGSFSSERSEHSLKKDGTGTPLSKEAQEKQNDAPGPGKCATKGETLLKKLKSVLQRGKRKSGLLLSGERAVDTTQDAEPCLKMSKVDSDTRTLMGNVAVTSFRDNQGVEDVSKMPSVDPVFAYALGLTPKDITDKIQKTEGQDTQPRKRSSETPEQSQIIQKPPSIIPKSGRIKTLKKHQAISADYVKQKWWLHFQTPSCLESEKLEYKQCTRDNSIRKKVKGKENSACSSADALNLLADLALRASNDQVPPQPHPAFERKPETSMKNCDVKKEVTSAPQESVLHALLRQPVGRAMLPVQSPSPSRLVGCSELIDLVSKEHAYSLRPSSSLLGLSGSPFQVSPLSGSTRLLHHHQALYGDRIKTLQPSVGQEDRSEHNRTPEHLKECRRKFRHSCSIVDMGESIKVTRHWKEIYDFNLDSKFTCDSKDRAVNRALHGPWDFSIQDTNEEVRLIVHMWIGLFYSRSTARFFNFESDLTHPCSGESDYLGVSSGMVSAPAQSDLKNLLAPPTSVSDPLHTKALDLRRKEDTVLDNGPMILDLSLKSSNAEIVTLDPQLNKKDAVLGKHKEASDTTKTPKHTVELQEKSKSQSEKTSTNSTEVNGVRSTNEKSTSSKRCLLEYIDVPSFKAAGMFILGKEQRGSVSVPPIIDQTTSGVGNNEKINTKDASEPSESTGMAVVETHGMDLSKSITGEEVDFIKDNIDVVHAVQHEKVGLKVGENLGVKVKPCQEGIVENSTQRIQNGHLFESTKQISNEGTAISSEQATVKADSNLSDQPSATICNGTDSVKDGITESICLAMLDKQLPQIYNKDHRCHNLQLRKLSADGGVLTDEFGISEKNQSAKVNLNTHNENHDTISVERERKVDQTTQQQLFQVSHSCKVVEKCEDEVTLTKEPVLKGDKTNEGAENLTSRVIIPFIGIDTSREDITVSPHALRSQDEAEEGQQQQELPFISESAYDKTPLITDVGTRSQMPCEKTVVSTGQISLSLCDVSEANQAEVLGSECDDRCPTPTMDEKPYAYFPCSASSVSSSISAPSDSETKSIHTQKSLNRSSSSVEDKLPFEQKLCHNSTVNSYPHHGIQPDLERRTLRVLQSIGKFFYKSNHSDQSSHIERAKYSLDQTHDVSNKFIPTCLAPSHTSADIKGQKINGTKTAMASAPTSQELSTESSDHATTPFKNKLEEVLGVRLQLNKSDSSVHQRDFERTDKLQETSVGQDYCHPHKSVSSVGGLQVSKSNRNQGGHKTPSPSKLSHEARSHSQRPVMAVKPSKSDDSQADCISGDRQFANGQIVISNLFKKQIQTSVIPYTRPTSILSKEETGSLQRNSERVKDKSMQSFESTASPTKPIGKSQDCMANGLAVKDEKITKDSIEMDQNYFPDVLTSLKKRESIIDEDLFLGPNSSLTCTVYNTGRKRSHSFLEQLSQRCIQEDPTKASVEQECLIFSEQMKQVLKRNKTRSARQLEAHNKLNLSCANPVTVHFSSLKEQEDSFDRSDGFSLVGQKFKVDISDRKDMADTKRSENTLHPPKEGTGNPLEHAGVSAVTAECSRLYEERMDDVCAVRKVPSRPKHFKMERGYPKTEPSDHFDFCDQMKREMDESFRNNLNSVVKKSSKTKYRFYVLGTSDNTFFVETKAQLEAEGHTAVQPNEFFLSESSSSSLLIILRNEDIAEHFCEVPHLLQLRRSPNVQFAGIDEPDDVVNLTHQEVFTKGGFIMFNRAVLEPLSLCNMKKISAILEELSRTEKWKWILHYRDSRRLKENARLSAEAKEKNHFLQTCQEAGQLEVLSYHECDLVSRDQPDYLTCLVRLQIQNISARYPVFVTDETTDGAFESNGILTMDFDSFLACSSSTFTV